jgi:hypothetical protein
MSKEVKVSVPNVYVSDLEKLAKKIRSVVGEVDSPVSFEFIIASLFPTSWENIQADLNRQYTKGYMQGRIDKEDELRRHSSQDFDCECYND